MNQETKDLTIISVDYWSDFAKELVTLATLKPNGKILDVGTGSGACLIAAADKLGKNCHLVGIDKNSAKVSQARNNFKNIVVESAQFRTMEASNLEFDDNELCSYGWSPFQFLLSHNRLAGRETPRPHNNHLFYSLYHRIRGFFSSFRDKRYLSQRFCLHSFG